MIGTAATPVLNGRPLSVLNPSGPPVPAGSTIEFIDVDFSLSVAREVIEAIRTRDPAAPFAYVVTPNVDHVVRLQRSRSDLWPVYRGAWMTLCDSQVLARMASWTSRLSIPVLPGSDLTARMFEEVIEPHDRVTIIGGQRHDVDALGQRYGLHDICHFDPPRGFIHNATDIAQAVQFVAQARGRYVLLAVGSPQQEILAHRIARAGGAIGIGLCVGASLDFLSGVQKRAPEVMRRFAVEWLYRLGTDPRRLSRRYLVDGPEIFRIAREWRARAL